MEFSNRTKLIYKRRGNNDVIDWVAFNKKIEELKNKGKLGLEFKFNNDTTNTKEEFIIMEYIKIKRAYRVNYNGLCVMLYQSEIRDADYSTFYNRALKLGYNPDGEIKQPVNLIKSAE